MTIVRRIVGGYAIAVVLIVILVTVGLIEFLPIEVGYEEENLGVLDRLGAASEVDHAAVAMGTSLAVALTDESEAHRAEFRDLLEQEIAAARESLSAADTLENTSQGQTALAGMATTFDEYVQKVEAALALAQTDNPAALESYTEEVVPAQKQMDELHRRVRHHAAGYAGSHNQR